jgi:N-methylhydantoinase A/oxoprolinase/acetone carboxylase beta subunit
MAQGIILSAIEKGHDPSEFTLIAGGGPALCMPFRSHPGWDQTAYIPRQAAVFCAMGAALADY